MCSVSRARSATLFSKLSSGLMVEVRHETVSSGLQAHCTDARGQSAGEVTSSWEIVATVMPCGRIIGSEATFNAAVRAYPREKRTRHGGIMAPLQAKLPAGVTKTSPSAIFSQATKNTVSSPGGRTQSSVATKRCIGASDTLAMAVSVR